MLLAFSRVMTDHVDISRAYCQCGCSVPAFVNIVVAFTYTAHSRVLVFIVTRVSGFKPTVPIGVQLRIWRDHRAG